MNIGEERETIVIEPIEEPVPGKSNPAPPEPDYSDPVPVQEPASPEPELVPA